MNTTDWTRRTALCSVLALLAGCQAAPPAVPVAAKPRLSPEQERVLREQGFEPMDDDWALMMPSKLLFPTDSDRLMPEQAQYVKRLAQTLQQVGLTQMRVEGHTDDTGSPEYNLQLSQRRAHSVAQALVAGGMVMEHIQIKGWGSTRPLAAGQNPTERRENRRVAIIVAVP